MVKKKPLYVLCGGVATVGKDTFCKLLIDLLPDLRVKRFALADQLKLDLQPFLLDEFGIDIFNCSPHEKELVRDILVAYGKSWRKKSQGTHWTELLQEEIDISGVDIAVVTDIRYSDPAYPEDELFWGTQKNNGLLVHITRLKDGSPIPPINEDEEKNDPKLQAAADFKIIWETVGLDDLESLKDKIRPIAEKIRQELH